MPHTSKGTVIRRSSKWSATENMFVLNSVQYFSFMEGNPYSFHTSKWSAIANGMRDSKSNSQIMHRWGKVMNPMVDKDHWNEENTQLLRDAIKIYGIGHWSQISREVFVGFKTGKQCREKYENHIRLGEKRLVGWSKAEDALLVAIAVMLQRIHGSDKPIPWQQCVRKYYPNRSANDLKNRYHILKNDAKKQKTKVGEDIAVLFDNNIDDL